MFLIKQIGGRGKINDISSEDVSKLRDKIAYNMIVEEEIVGIIQSKLEGNLKPEGANRLNDWLEVPANEEAYKQYVMLWDSTGMLAEKKERYTPNTEKSWEAIEQYIVTDKPKRRFKIGYAAAAAVAFMLLFFGANYLFNGNGDNGNIQYVLQVNEKDTLTFSDGSLAYLFGPCSITYPEEFTTNERTVSMKGLVYFDIAHDETRPFEINTENGKVEVLGTTFIVDTRQDETFTVQCITGKVRVSASENGKSCETILTKNKMATYTSESQQLAVSTLEPNDLNIEIPLHNLTFNNKPLGEILKRIEYSYGVSIQLENEHLVDMKYSTSLNDSTLDDFLNELKITFKVKVVQTKPSTYVLKGGSSN